MERKERTQMLLEAYKNESNVEAKRDIENEIIRLNDGLCASIVWRYRMDTIEIDDAMQITRVAMLKAIRTFDGSALFSTYATNLMRNRLFTAWRRTQRLSQKAITVRLDKATVGDCNVSDIISNGRNEQEESADRQLLMEILLDAPNVLTQKEHVVFLYYLGLSKQHRDRDVIAQELGCKKNYISMLKKRAFEKIRRKYEPQMIR